MASVQKPMIVVTGPTASGKTALAVALCRQIGGEVVSADSMQVYREMNIGTAKPDASERAGVVHHMIDIVNPNEPYNVQRYAQEAAACIADIHSRGRIPVLSGGTGFYVDAVTRSAVWSDAGADEAYRESLRRLGGEEGPESLHRQLSEVDPVSAAAIHPHNIKRVIRALEVYHLTGKPRSSFERKPSDPPFYPYACFGLSMNRQALYERIDRRVDAMMGKGLTEEVAGLLRRWPDWSETARQALGYKELIDYLEGRCDENQAVDTLKRRTRNYAKRQLTWFRPMKDIEWLNSEYVTEEQRLRVIHQKLIEKSFPIM